MPDVARKLQGRTAIVTGGGAGIGEAACVLFAREGAHLVVADCDEARSLETTRTIIEEGGKAISVTADVTNPADVARIVSCALDAFGPPNILFNNAGVNLEKRRMLTKIADEDFDRTVAVNLKGPFLMMKHVVPHMIAAGGGSIVNTASIAAFDTVSTAGYSASKAGLVAMTRVAAAELGKHRIRVNALCPGATLTPLAASQRESMQAQGLPVADKLMEETVALRRMGEAVEMARMALFLVSDDVSYATGQPFIVDGGWMLHSGVEKSA